MTNDQAIAYMQIALIKQGMTEEEVTTATVIMKGCFDEYTEEEAEEMAPRLWNRLWKKNE